MLAATPATAGAQFGQVEPLTLRGDDDCVRTTGAPGELALPATDGVRFAQATRAGVQLGRTVTMGKGFECSAAVTRASGAGVIAGELNDSVVASVRAPGGDWGAPVSVPVERTWRADDVAAAVSDRGDVIVTWREESTRYEERRTPYRFRAVRAAAGAAFGAAETLGASSPLHEAILPAIAATGEAFVLTSTAEGTGSELRSRLNVYTGVPGAAFGAPAALGTGQWLSAPAIAAAPDGRVLVAFSDGTSQRVAERAPGGAFAPAVSVGDARDTSVTATLLTVGAGGEAVVAWARYARGDVQFAARVAAGPFGAPSRISSPLLPEGFDPFYASRAFFAYIIDGAGGLSYEPAYTDLVLTGDGRAALAWFQGGSTTIPALLTTPLSGGAVTRAPGGRGIESPQTLRALTLADGTPALAWTEPGSGSSYTLHLAAEGVVERPDPAPPRVTIGAPRSRTLSEEEPLRLPVRCDGPCEVGVAADSLTSGLSDTVRLRRAGSGVLQRVRRGVPRPRSPRAGAADDRLSRARREARADADGHGADRPRGQRAVPARHRRPRRP